MVPCGGFGGICQNIPDHVLCKLAGALISLQSMSTVCPDPMFCPSMEISPSMEFSLHDICKREGMGRVA